MKEFCQRLEEERIYNRCIMGIQQIEVSLLIKIIGVIIVLSSLATSASQSPSVLIIDDDNDIKFDDDESVNIFDSTFRSLGYDVSIENADDTSYSTWSDYDIIVWSCGDDYTAVHDSIFKEMLVSHINDGGYLILESGNIATAVKKYGDAYQFREKVLHITKDWIYTDVGDLTLAVQHPIATTPHSLPDPIDFNPTNPGDDSSDADGIFILSDATGVYKWSHTNYKGNPLGKETFGLMVYQETNGGKIIYFAFDIDDIDNSGNQYKLIENAVKWLNSDTIDPRISIEIPSHNQSFETKTIIVSGKASDNIGLDKVEVNVNSGIWKRASSTTSWTETVTLSPGINIICARATDIAGNTNETSVTVTYNPDTIDPTISIIEPTDNQFFSTRIINVSGDAFDNIGLDKVEVKVNSGTWDNASGTTSWTKTVTLSPEINIICARATDTSGNTNETSVTVIYTDTTDPTVCIEIPTHGKSFETKTINVSGNAFDNIGLDKVEVKVNSGTWDNASGTTSWTETVTLSPGENIICARATDTSGNTNETSVTVTYNPDIVLPTISISSPSDGENFNTTTIKVEGEANCSSNLDLDKVEIKVNGERWQPASCEPLWSGKTLWSKEITLSLGTNTIHVKATDTSGNYSQASVTVTVYNESIVLPAVFFLSPSDGQTFNISTISVTGEASSDEGIDKVEIYVNGESWQRASGTTSWNRIITLSLGTNTINVRATDKSGITNVKSVTVTFNPDIILPNIFISSPSSGQVFNTSTIPIIGTAYADVGVYTVDVKVNGGNWYRANGTTPWNTEGTLIPGTNTIYARATDELGNKNIASVTIECNPPCGTIIVNANIDSATFTIYGPDTYLVGTGRLFCVNNRSVGTYTISYGPVSGYKKPSSETGTLSADEILIFTGNYEEEKKIEVIATLLISIATLITALVGIFKIIKKRKRK